MVALIDRTERPAPAERSPLTADQVSKATWRLRQLHMPHIADRERLRAIMDGGDAGIRTLLGPKAKKSQELIPAANMILSAGTKLATKIGHYPTMKVHPPEDSDAQSQLDHAELVEGIVETHDRWARVRMQMPYIGRWLPGYGFYVQVIRERPDRDGNPYPALELRDPYDCYPGTWGIDQVPREMALLRRVDEARLFDRYPSLARKVADGTRGRTTTAGWSGGHPDSHGARWDTVMGEGILVAEYYNDDGWWYICPQADEILEFEPNVAPGIPQFVIGKRFTFSALVGAYGHALGLQVAQARLTMWGIIAMQDAVFAETNIYGGEPRGGSYLRGRGATNVFPQGTRVERPNQNLPYQAFQQIDRIERMLRNQVSYPVTDDAESPVGYATGPAVENLNDVLSGEVHEYKMAICDAMMRADSIRLAWDEIRFGGRYRKSMHRRMRTYDPRSIRGSRDTDRIYGVMSGYDDPRKVVAAIQMMGAGLLDPQTAAEGIEGIDNWSKIDERNKARRVEQGLLAAMEQAGMQGDRAAIMALIDMLAPGDTKSMFQKYFKPEDPQPTPEEMAMAGQLPPGTPPPSGDEAVQTALSQLGIDGGIKGGSQVVATI